jgi:hypothetical protein
MEGSTFMDLFGAGGVAQDCLPSKHKALSSKPQYCKKKKSICGELTFKNELPFIYLCVL